MVMLTAGCCGAKSDPVSARSCAAMFEINRSPMVPFVYVKPLAFQQWFAVNDGAGVFNASNSMYNSLASSPQSIGGKLVQLVDRHSSLCNTYVWVGRLRRRWPPHPPRFESPSPAAAARRGVETVTARPGPFRFCAGDQRLPDIRPLARQFSVDPFRPAVDEGRAAPRCVCRALVVDLVSSSPATRPCTSRDARCCRGRARRTWPADGERQTTQTNWAAVTGSEKIYNKSEQSLCGGSVRSTAAALAVLRGVVFVEFGDVAALLRGGVSGLGGRVLVK